jgi:hypothetical protein
LYGSGEALGYEYGRGEYRLSIPNEDMSVKRTHMTEDLGIQLSSKKEEELFKWFLACLLYGKPIQQQVAERAFLTLAAARLLSGECGPGERFLSSRLHKKEELNTDHIYQTARNLIHNLATFCVGFPVHSDGQLKADRLCTAYCLMIKRLSLLRSDFEVYST